MSLTRVSVVQTAYARGDGHEWSTTRTVNGLLTAPRYNTTLAALSTGLVATGGITVTAGGLAVDADTAIIHQSDDSDPLLITERPTAGYTSTLLKVQSTQVSSSGTWRAINASLAITNCAGGWIRVQLVHRCPLAWDFRHEH